MVTKFATHSKIALGQIIGGIDAGGMETRLGSQYLSAAHRNAQDAIRASGTPQERMVAQHLFDAVMEIMEPLTHAHVGAPEN